MRQTVAWTILAAGAAALPWLTDAYVVSLATNALILTLLAASTHLLSVAGLPSFGQSAYLGVSAYTAALLAQACVTDTGIHLLAGTLAATVAAALTGPVVLRTRSAVFLMVTLAIGQLTVTIAATSPLLGRDEGLATPAVTLPGTDPITLDGYLYLYALAITCPVLAATGWLLRTRLALRWRPVAGHEPRTAALGHHPGRILMAAHLCAAAVAGTAGALLIAAHRYVSPTDLGMDTASCALLACAIGRGRLGRTVLAAAGIVAIRDLLGAITGGYGNTLLGLAFIAAAYQHLWPHRHTTIGGRLP